MFDPNLKAAEADAAEVTDTETTTEQTAATQEQGAGAGELID